MSTTTTIKIGNRSFEVTTRTDSKGAVQYVLTGARGARYVTMRNANRTDQMFLINARGFGIAAEYKGVWFTDRNGSLERLLR